jgi:putative transposase
MAKPYSSDLRERVVRAVVADGLSRRAASQRFGISVSTVITWMQRWRDTGHIEPGQMGGRRPKKIAGAWRTWLVDRSAIVPSRCVVWLVNWRSVA